MIHSALKFHGIALFGAALLYLIVLPYNLSFSPDSITYMEVADNLVSGKGVTNYSGHLVKHWPPLFSLLISFVAEIFDMPVLKAGMILQVMLFYLFLIVNMFILQELKVNHTLILLFGLCLIFSQASINFLNYLSEGLFFVLLGISYNLFLKWTKTDKSLNLYLCALVCGLFFLARYAGIAFFGCYIVYILFLQNEPMRQRLNNVLKVLLVFIIVVSPWFIYQSFFEKPPVGREIAVHLIPLEKIQDMFITYGYWFLGSKLAIFLSISVMIFYLLKLKQIRHYAEIIYKSYSPAVIIIFLFFFIYPAFLIISISFFDSYTPMDNRILSPLLIFFLILFFLFLDKLWKNGEKKLVYASVVFFFLSFSSSLYPNVKNHYLNGGGYAKKMWVESEVISFLRDQNFDTPIFSNGTELGILHLSQHFQMLPGENDDLNIIKLKKDIREGDAKIVFFYNVNWRNYLVNEQWLKENFSDLAIIELKDGFVITKIASE